MDLVLTEFGTFLGKSGARFVVKRHGKETVEMPAEDVTSILITGKGVSLSSDAVQLAMEHGATITFLKFSGEPYAKLLSPKAFGRARLRREQLMAAGDGRGLTLCRSFLRGKLRNQMSNLRYFAKSRKESALEIHEELHAHADAIDELLRELEALPGAALEALRMPLMNREARAAVEYWRGIARILPEDLAFPGRVRRGATDAFNVSLNYGYGILYSRLWSVLLGVGLDPYGGFLHVYEDNRPTLVFDFIEEFRQFTVDRPVVASFTRRWHAGFDDYGFLDHDSRSALAARVLEQINAHVPYEGRRVKLGDVMKSEAHEVVAVITGEGRHEPYVAEW